MCGQQIAGHVGLAKRLAWPPEAVAAECPGKWPLLCQEASPFVHLLVHRVSPGAGIGGARVRKIFRHCVWPSAGWAFLRLSQACFFPLVCMSAVLKAFDNTQHPAPGSEFTLATHSARRALQRLSPKHSQDRCALHRHPRQEWMGFPEHSCDLMRQLHVPGGALESQRPRACSGPP